MLGFDFCHNVTKTLKTTDSRYKTNENNGGLKPTLQTDFAVLVVEHGLEARATTAKMAVLQGCSAWLNTYWAKAHPTDCFKFVIFATESTERMINCF